MPSPSAQGDDEPLAWTSRLGAAISFAAPFAVALGHVGTAPAWRDDLVLLRGMAWLLLGRTGNVSALLTQAALFVPLGSVHFRLGVMAAAVLGAAGFVVYTLVRQILVRLADAPPLLTDALATIAALTATLSATGQREGGAAGGSGVALLLAMLVLGAQPAQALQQPRRAFGLGMLGGALLAESAVTGVALATATVLGLSAERQWPAQRAVSFALGGAAATAGFFSSPAIIRMFASTPFLDIGQAAGAMQAAAPAIRPFGGALVRLSTEGGILVPLGALGLGLGLVKRELRGAVVPLIAMTALYGASVFGEGRLFLAEDLAPLHGVATASLATGAALVVQALATALLAWQLPMAKGAAILLVMTDLTLAVATAEEAFFAYDRSAWRGADVFTDEALEDLPPRSALLVRTRACAWRLWAAQLAHGSRPDVLIVPVAATFHPRLALRLLRAEPALHKVLQDISLDGRPGEEALTLLASARPVLVELDPAWDRRVFSHFVPDHLWLRFAPEPRGPSDRKAAFSDLHARADRVLAASLYASRSPRFGDLKSRCRDGREVNLRLCRTRLGQHRLLRHRLRMPRHS